MANLRKQVDMAKTTATPAPVDIATMRVSARLLLADGAQQPSPEELDTLNTLLRGHLNLMVPEVEAATLGLPKDDIPRACALACCGEARMRLRIGWPQQPEAVRLSVARKLARSVNALCDHWENLAGAQGSQG